MALENDSSASIANPMAVSGIDSKPKGIRAIDITPRGMMTNPVSGTPIAFASRLHGANLEK